MKKALAILLVFILILTCLSGCSSSDSDSEESSSPSEGEESSDSSSSDSVSKSSSQGEEKKDEGKSGVIKIEGSTAFQPLLTMSVGKFMEGKEFKGTVTINGSDSIQGIKKAMEGTVDIGISDISPEQAGIDGAGLVDHQVAIVAIGVAVSKDVASNLEDISAADLKGIYSGKITNWEQVKGWKGGSVPISVIYRKKTSGTRYLFDTYGSGAALSDEQIGAMKHFSLKESTNEVYSAIETGQGMIGYLALPYCSKLKLLKLDGVEAKYEKVYTGEYKIWGVEHLYTKGEPKGAVKKFVEFLTAQEFEESISKNGYGVISEMKVSR